MTTKLGLILTILFAATSVAEAGVSEADITAAYRVADTDKLELLREDLAKTGTYSDYLTGYLDWRLAGLLLGANRDEDADEVLARAEDTLVKLCEAEPQSAEAHALLASVIGMSIGIRPMSRGMFRGPKASRATEKALEIEPDNPRVLLIAAIGKLNTPAMFGGSHKKAMMYLNKALTSIESNGSGKHGWGHADIFVWRGMAHARKGNNEEARSDFAAALAVAPDYEWARALGEDLNARR